MADLVLYMAKSGAGKTSSLRNMPKEQTVLITPNTKTLPFPGGDAYYNVENKTRIVTDKLTGDPSLPADNFGHYPLQQILKLISDNQPEVKYICIDDFTHFFTARIFSNNFLEQNSGNAAFNRWNVFGADVFQSVLAETDKLRDDLTIVIMHHTELKDDGTAGFKSSGNLLEKTIDFPSYFTYVFHGLVLDDDSGTRYVIQTNQSATKQAKSPYGMFDREKELYVPNDMFKILERIKAYKAGNVEVKWVD